ncbi:MAG TPA: DNA-protecting protein DprA [Acidimicrobiaceae bacterium]|nr:DNA-protecting protein DprA [Acidimicrobiaceae bacterium]
MSRVGSGDDERAALATMLGLPGMGPARLTAVVDRAGTAVAAWELVRRGDLAGIDLRLVQRRAELVDRWVQAARGLDPADVLDRHRAAGVEVLLPDDAAWPSTLAHDPEPPRVLFVRGDVALLERPGVAVVGTRRCTAGGAQIAGRFGAGLAAAGLTVVSGLALGVDGAAHRGALGAGGIPVGVVGSGLDVVYPARHRRLWADVAERGVLVGEAPLGAAPERWRFPARNRIIAALSLAVVVVESGARGGSITTAEEATARDVPVLAVPGSVLAEQSVGTNQLLFDGSGIARDVPDVLAALGVQVPVGTPRLFDVLPADGLPGDVPAEGGGAVGAVAAVLSAVPASVERVAAAADVSVTDAVTALARLEASGAVRRVPGGYERVAVP